MIGARLCEKLLEKKYDIVCIDKKNNKWNPVIDKLTLKVDLRNKKKIFAKIPKNVDLIIHLAANARVFDLIKNPVLARDNLETTFNILEFARINNIKKIIFSSSREIYGGSKKLKFKERDTAITKCENTYAASKISNEALIQSYFYCYGINFIILRLSNVYGMYDMSDRIIPLFIRLCQEGKDLVIFGKDKMLEFTYIDDIVNGIMLAMKKFDSNLNQTFNLAYGQGISLFDLAKIIKEEMKAQASKITIKKNRPGEVMHCIIDITKARQQLNYLPQFDIQKGIKKTIPWYLNN